VNPIELKGIPLLEDFSEDEREHLLDHLEAHNLSEGRVLFEEGTESDCLVLVLSGAVELETQEAGKVGRMAAGSALGGLSLVTPGRRGASAVAAGDCDLVSLDRGAFRRLMEDAPRVACKLLEALLREAAGSLREGLPLLKQTIDSANGPQ
jgi:CRP-like cAMP-binding protein